MKLSKDRENPAMLEQIFAGTTARLVDHLTTFKGFEYTVNELCNILDISYKVILTTLKELEKHDLVENTKFRPIKWQLKDNSQTQLLRKFLFDVMTKDIERSAKAF